MARRSARTYARTHPTPEYTLLLIEVADTSLAEDRRDKIPMYLAAGVPEVWLLDLLDHRLLRFVLAEDPIAPAVLAEGDPLPIGEGLLIRDLLP